MTRRGWPTYFYAKGAPDHAALLPRDLQGGFALVCDGIPCRDKAES
jgi:hypothetical protein